MPTTRTGKETWSKRPKCAVHGCDRLSQLMTLPSLEGPLYLKCEPGPYCLTHGCSVNGCERLAFHNADGPCCCQWDLADPYWCFANGETWSPKLDGWHHKCMTHGKYACVPVLIQ